MTPAQAAASGPDEMAALMTRFTKADGIQPTAIARLFLARFSRAGVPMPTVYPPCLCVAQNPG